MGLLKGFSAGLLALGSLCLAPLAFGATYNTLVTLNPGTSNSVQMNAISGANATGYYSVTGQPGSHAFVYNFDSHQYTQVDPTDGAAGTYTYPSGISGNLVAGNCFPSSGNGFSFVYDLTTKVSTTFSVSGSDFTTAGGVSGNYVTGQYGKGSEYSGFLYNISSKVCTPIKVTGAVYTYADGVSGNTLAGYYYDGTRDHCFLYSIDTAVFTFFDPPNDSNSSITGISGNIVAGNYYINGVSHSFIYRIDTQAVTLLQPAPGSNYSTSTISGNYVAGTYEDGAGNTKGFTYKTSTAVYTLLTTPSGGSGYPTGVSSGNVVTGSYYDTNNNAFGFLAFNTNSTITFSGNLNPTYDGTSKALTVTTSPAGLAKSVTYQLLDSLGAPVGDPLATPTGGTLNVVATVNDGTHVAYASTTLTIQPINVTVSVTPRAVTYDGSPHGLVVTTAPANANVILHYAGNSNFFGDYPAGFAGETDGPPANAGIYYVTVTGVPGVNVLNPDPDLTHQTLTITTAPQTVTLPSSATVNDVITLPETTAAGFTITYFFLANNNVHITSTAYAALTNAGDNLTDNILTIKKKGSIVLYASAPGDPNHDAADPGGESVGVSLDNATITFGNLVVNYDGQHHAATFTTDPTTIKSADVAVTYSDAEGNNVGGPPAAAGTYQVSAIINDTDDMYQGSATATMVIGQTALGWQQQHFTTAQLADAAVSGFSATPQHDGVPNLLKFLCDIDPSQPMKAADQLALPKVTINPASTMLILTYRKNGAMAGTGVTVQTSTSLLSNSWVPAANTVTSQSNAADPIVQIQVPITSTRQFIRLNIAP